MKKRSKAKALFQLHHPQPNPLTFLILSWASTSAATAGDSNAYTFNYFSNSPHLTLPLQPSLQPLVSLLDLSYLGSQCVHPSLVNAAALA
uniref:Putative secreted protein n=1 Tax=Ixodes ricinus TaxID=34613 RepID=A0A6B0UCR1_IXORI